MPSIAEGVEGFVGLARRANKLAVGLAACEQAVAKRQAELIILATDLSRGAAARFRSRMQGRAVRILVHGTKAEWGRLLGRQEAGILAVLDRGLATAITEKLNSGAS